MKRFFWTIVSLCIFSVFLSAPIYASMVPLNVDDITRLAKVIFIGEFISGATIEVEKRPAIKSIFKVEEVTKGEMKVGDMYELIQYLPSPVVIKRGYSPERFVVGQRYILFLSEKRAGVSHLIGSGAAFKIIVAPDGKAQVVNRHNNRWLFKGLKERTAVKGVKLSTSEKSLTSVVHGPVELKTFKGLVKKLVDVKPTGVTTKVEKKVEKKE